MRAFRLCLALAVLAAPATGWARQDRVFTKDDADAVLGDQPDASDADCPVKLPNGQCARTADERRFRLAPSARAGEAPKADRASSTRAKAAPRARTRTARAARRAPARELPISFLAGSYELSEQSKRNVQTLATAMNTAENREKRIRITGHTDRSGSAELNRTLSQQRAQAVADYMTGLGVARERLDVQGMAFDRLLPGLSAYSPAHRRVEVERF